ncbi:MAG: M42 family peptidase [Oscillospiraceae bacterium]|nr:M42 family peptidase [Oscillospiraceae bacterium]
MFDTYDTLLKLSSIAAPSGNEQALRNCLADLAKPYADECDTDTLGNLIVRKKGSGKKILLTSQMDSAGLAVTHIDEKGFLRFCRVGEVEPEEIKNVIFANGTRGAVCREPKVKTSDAKDYNYFIDIGAASRNDALNIVNIGDIAVNSAIIYTNNDNIFSPFLSSRIGCVVLLQILSMLNNPINDIYFLFCTQDEVGHRGAKTAAFAADPDICLSIGITNASDIPGTKASFISLNKGAVIRLRDNALISHPGVVSWLESAADNAEIPIQREVLSKGGTGAGAAHISRAGVPSGTVTVPVRYALSSTETACLSDISSCVRLIYTAINTEVNL